MAKLGGATLHNMGGELRVSSLDTGGAERQGHRPRRAESEAFGSSELWNKPYRCPIDISTKAMVN